MLANATVEVFRLAKSSVIQASVTLLTFPVQLLGRIRKLGTDDRWTHSSENMFAFTVMRDVHSDEFLLSQSPPPPISTPLPGPWSFLTSWYVFGLVVMAVLLHRIRNIVVPRDHFITRFTRTARLRASANSFIPPVFPLDLSSSITRLVLRSPSLYFILKMVAIWLIVLAQTADKFPTWDLSSLQLVGTYVAKRETADLCWSTFCAVCGVLCMEGLTHGLEGGAHRPSPFNLLGYAFLLHTYSSPVTHWVTLEGSTSRPDKHVVFTILLPLLQLAVIHSIGIKQDWSSHRLFPSMFASFLALTHFHSVMWLSDSSYPLLSYVPCLFESTLLAVIFLALFLNAFTQLATEGTISRFLFGHQAALLPQWDEDFSVALLRMGTASLEASCVLGLGNQVGGVAAVMPLPFNDGTVELNRMGVASLSPAVEGSIKHPRFKKGFCNEVKTVKITTTGGDIWVDMTWCKELARLGMSVVRCVKGLIMKFWKVLNRRSRKPPNFPPRRIVVRSEATTSQRNQDYDEEAEEQQELYERFIRGEPMDEEDEDFEYYPSEMERDGSVGSASSSSEHSSEEEEEGEKDPRQDTEEIVSLFSDLSSGPSAMTSAPVLVAHMIHDSSLPMTRRRFQHLTSTPSQRTDSFLSDWSDVAAIRRSSSSGTAPHEDETMRNCVICTVEPRQIICWPCRCLAVCDDCRENLASRSSASTHTCPCCRRSVDGYSKIYIP
ncbi:uncharacterized protein EDB93DRAFT_1141905 [Suillus bovinus]|uniref:uncharacterized protein n=1 Tax=Suillus bovinus TaxID=48563 RepID=UPI001B85EB6A|nr:uncharacterized protein EDB93DRAFT_1141905 [Suillus bovinus]KAG2150733.1 hypothetical protein EDB93DRAFT_1141905 [Suillus bovinus]